MNDDAPSAGASGAGPEVSDDPASTTGEAGRGPHRRLWIISDLHRDLGWEPFDPRAVPQADVAVVAGDVCQGLALAVEWAAMTIRPHMPVIMVAGNHEFYGGCLEDEFTEGMAAAAREGIDLLENRTVEVAGLRFSGCTLWTDYALYGDDQRWSAMAAAVHGINDHRLVNTGTRGGGGQRFLPEAAYHRHCASRLYLAQTLLESSVDARRQVVVTHHAPHPRSVAARYERHPLNPAFVSDLGDLLAAARPGLWIHGHTHSSMDYVVGATRVICNPLGYGRENPAFDPQLVVQVPS